MALWKNFGLTFFLVAWVTETSVVALTTLDSVKGVPVGNVDCVSAAIPVHLVRITSKLASVNRVVTSAAGDRVVYVALAECLSFVGTHDGGRISHSGE